MRTEFGPFIIDPEARLLRRGQADLHLSPKAFDLLWLLVEHRPRVIEKGELHARIWPDTHVADGSLNVLIGEIRRTLGDDAREPRYVRTAHGVGYAFCGEADAAAAPGRVALRCWLTQGNTTYRLTEGENTVGRDPECTVWLNSTSVSRLHAKIFVDSRNGSIEVEDLGSKNGTLVRGEPVDQRVALSHEEPVVFGSVELTVHVWSADRASETKRISRRRP